ncbi:unnamed protein product [Phytophthora fragariaefolia]|uniref:Unnamed protein product n=1 Tax=Phytophthora fragariaefolia TaxID=1490495 RepID=A0A9W7DF32_9STRA|nr:unnamed protein product [Phytophthora fragariaefolia]
MQSVSFILGALRFDSRRVREAIVVNPSLMANQGTAPWVQAFSTAPAQVSLAASAAADSPSDMSSARTPIPAADQADFQAKLGANAPIQAGLDVLIVLASTAEISVSVFYFFTTYLASSET